MIKIGKPFVEVEGDIAKLCAEINVKNQKEIMWYAVPKSYEKYLVYEQGDAFVIPMLYTAATLGMNIHSETPISDNLLFQLNHHLLPVMSKQHNNPSVKVIADTPSTVLSCEGKVGTGYSAGVDSFYSIMKHTSPIIEEDSALYRPRLDTLCVINVGVSRSETADEEIKKLYLQSKEVADILSLNALYINSNVYRILRESYLSVYTIRLMGAVLALQKYFGVYLLSSGIMFNEFHLSSEDFCDQDLFNIQCISTEMLNFISCGAGVLRINKLKSLSNYPICYTRLHSCIGNSEKNCGFCGKCRRDIVSLFALGKLELFREVFDIEKAKKNIDFSIAYLISRSTKTGQILSKNVIDLLYEINYPIPERCYKMAEQFKKSMKNLEENK